MKIAIFGMARSGQSVFKHIIHKTSDEVFCVNQGDPNSWSCFDLVREHIDKCYAQSNSANILSDMDLIVLSPGIPRSVKELDLAHSRKIPVISEIEYAFRHSDIPVVGITGTNGKTTTTTMIAQALEQFDKKPFICGNIGIPYTDLLLAQKGFDFAIVELSSFQLESIDKFHPNIAILINITNSHMERYDSVSDYTQAKMNIFKNQTSKDFAITGVDVKTQAQKINIEALDGFDFSHSKIIGEHNKYNFFCAYKVCEILKLSDLDVNFQKFINSFKGVGLRLEYVSEYNGLSIYNDSKSTNDAATVAAVDSFSKSENLYLILGGQLRSNDLTLESSLKNKSITKIFAFGEAARLIKNVIKEYDVIVFENLEEIFDYLKNNNLSGNLLFSPAFPSFDQFDNYEDRGARFNELANQL